MTHSLGGSSPGATGVAYASGVRVAPGGSAFTLTGIFIDRITPRLLRVAAMAKMTTASINSVAPAMRAQISILQMQATRVGEVATRYKLLTRRVKEYQLQLDAARARMDTRYPLRYAGGTKVKGKERGRRIGLREAYLGPYKSRLVTATALAGVEKGILLNEGMLLRVEKAITKEKWKQVALGKEALRAGFADISGRRAGLKGLKYGAVAGMVGIAAAGLGVIALSAMQMEYTKTAAQVRAIGQLSLTEIGRLSDFILEKTKVLAIAAEKSMTGMLTLVRAGLRESAEMEGLMVPGMKLAIVNTIELQDALRNILVVQNAFNLSRDTGNEIAANQQILINQSLMDFSDYVDGMKYAIAWSNKLGLTYQQTAAAIATMTDAGIRAGIGGRGMRRMFSKFAQDLEIIEDRLKRGGSNLTVFTEDGVLDLSALLHELGESGDVVEDLEFALSTFGLRGSTAFLTLAQHADEFDEHVLAQTGDINVLDKAVKDAQESMAGQWQLMKNELKAVMLNERLVEPMKELVKHMKEEGGITKLAESLGDMFEMFIDFWKEGAFEMLINAATTFMNIMKGLMPILLPLGKALMYISESAWRLFPLILISRIVKTGTAINRLVTSLLTYRALSMMSAGQAMRYPFMYSRFIDPTYMMMAMGRGPGAAGGMMGRTERYSVAPKTPGKTSFLSRFRRGGAIGGAGAMGLAGIGGIISLAAIGGIGAYMLYKAGEAKTEERAEKARRENAVNINFSGANIYGFNDLDKAIQESLTRSYDINKRNY